MSLLTLTDVHKTYGDRHLLRGVSIVVGDADRIGLLGPNGCGKSTLLRILAGQEQADLGARTQRRGLELGHLAQEPELRGELSVRDAVREGLRGRDDVLARLETVHAELAAAPPDRLEVLLREQGRLEDLLTAHGGHDVEHLCESMIHDVGLADPDASCGALSGGERRRVALARLLLSGPDLLLLDEPTNHLDAAVIAWLEDHLRNTGKALVVVTHDRYFLDRVVDRIVEIEHGELHGYDGAYTDFLLARAERLARAGKSEATRRNLLRRETEWMRRGPPARTTKSKSRIQRYQALADAEPEAAAGEVSFEIPCAHRLGERVLELERVSKALGGRELLRGLDLELGRGQRLGIAGPNGAGKTTLLRLCMGELAPDSGTVTIGPTVRFSSIDQTRSNLDPDKTVVAEVGGGNDHVAVAGRKLRIESFLDRFLFPTSMMLTRVGDLSGGERNRVLLAKLLSTGGNVLVLDEPTNDLDLMTLRVLEEALIAFPGAALIVSHDRFFLDRVATRVVWLDGDGRHRVHEGDLSALLDGMAADARAAVVAAASPAARATRAGSAAELALRARKLSTRERRELDGLPDQIAAAEAQLGKLDAQLADPALYGSGDPSVVRELTRQRGAADGEVRRLYARWEELE